LLPPGDTALPDQVVAAQLLGDEPRITHVTADEASEPVGIDTAESGPVPGMPRAKEARIEERFGSRLEAEGDVLELAGDRLRDVDHGGREASIWDAGHAVDPAHPAFPLLDGLPDRFPPAADRDDRADSGDDDALAVRRHSQFRGGVLIAGVTPG
jgi:hypothetical protein